MRALLTKASLVSAPVTCLVCQKQRLMLCLQCGTIPQNTQPVAGGKFITLNPFHSGGITRRLSIVT